MKTNIYLVRHADSVYSTDERNRPLSERGISDAARVAELLAYEGITHVVSSPYRRAMQTVEGIARRNGIAVEMDDRFRERKLAANPVEHFQEAVLQAWEDFGFALPGGESGYDAQKRGVAALMNVIQRHGGGNIAIGTHGNIMALMLNYYDKRYDYAFWRKLSMPDIYRLTVEQEALVEIQRVW